MLAAMVIRWKRWAGSAAAAVALYAALGFWAAPWIIKRELASYAHEQLQRQVSVGDLRFNPFTLRLEATALKLDESNGDPILGIGHLAVELRWRSLLSRAWRFAEIAVDRPAVSLAIAPDGRFNIAQLVAAATRGSPASPSSDATLPRMIIERLAITEGRVDLQDRHAGYSNTFAPVAFELRDFSTLPDRNDEYTFSAASKSGGAVHWKGHASVNPIRATGELAIDDVPLHEPSAYLKSIVPVTVLAGKLSATLPYDVSYAAGKLDARLDRAHLSARELALQTSEKSAPLKLDVNELDAQLTLQATQEGNAPFDLKVRESSLSLSGLAASKGAEQQKLARLGFDGAYIDLASHDVTITRAYAEGAQIRVARNRFGVIDLANWIPKNEGHGKDAPRPADHGGWTVSIGTVTTDKLQADIADEQSGVKLQVVDAHARLEGVGTDLQHAVKFDAGLSLREGGQVQAEGTFVPASGSVQAQLNATKIALKPLQPLLAQYVKLKIASGDVSAKGKLSTGTGTGEGKGKDAALHWDGSFNIDNVMIRELDNAPFASWKNIGAARVLASVSPNRLEIPELRVTGVDTKLLIEEDRSLNAARLLVKHETKPAPSNAEEFPVRIRRVRISGAKLDFTDLSLRPQFAAKIQDLNGVVNGLSTSPTARAQIELDGRVDEFGMARVRGETSLAAPKNNTDVNLVFRNIDMVPASPYSMKFAGYRIAEGKISLDLQYKIRDGKLDGDNKIVIDKLTLGERVDSPDALKIPLQLAIAILKDTDGRIDLGLPVSGDLNDPQFSYGAVIWKAIGNVLTRIVTAPFRALGAMLGVGGDKLEAIDFDPGSSVLHPPEREKLKQVAQILSKRESLKLSIPGEYSPAADGAALRARAVRIDVAKQAAIELKAGEEPGPLDFGDRRIRSALREVYAKRFGDGELDKAKKAAESAAGAASAPASQRTLPLWQRAANVIQGEPQVSDASAFYNHLRERLEREHALPADALKQLGEERAKVVAAALAESGVDAARAGVGAAEATDSSAGKPVPLKLGLLPR
jgi:uncharacterized protein involved in outer membrane biogenesis